MAWLQVLDSSFLTNADKIDLYLRKTLPEQYEDSATVEEDEPLWDSDFAILMRYNLVFNDNAPEPFEKLINPVAEFLEDEEYVMFVGMGKTGWYISPVQLLIVTNQGAIHSGSAHWEEALKKRAIKSSADEGLVDPIDM